MVRSSRYPLSGDVRVLGRHAGTNAALEATPTSERVTDLDRCMVKATGRRWVVMMASNVPCKLQKI